MELIGDIRQMAYDLMDTKIKEEQFITIEDEPAINLFDRWQPGEERDMVTAVLFPDNNTNEEEEVDFTALFDQFTIDKKKLQQRIDQMLEAKGQATLKEIIDTYGIENGLSEVVGYFSLATESSHHIIIEDAKEPIKLGERWVNVPMIIYTKPTVH
jgi:hypothetical protein